MNIGESDTAEPAGAPTTGVGALKRSTEQAKNLILDWSTPPQTWITDLVRSVWSTTMGKVAALVGLGELSDSFLSLPLGLLTAIIEYLEAMTAYWSKQL